VGLVSVDPDELFPNVRPVEQPQERVSSVLDAVGDRLSILELVILDPPPEPRIDVVEPIGVIADDKPLNASAGPLVEMPRTTQPVVVVFHVVESDLPADGHARVVDEVFHDGVGYLPTNVLEVEVDAARAGVGDRRREVIGRAVVDRCVEAEVVGEPVGLRPGP